MAEVHFIGYITGATDFPSANLTTKYRFIAGEDWNLLEGSISGQTQIDLPKDGKHTVWSHPIDLHYSTKSLKAWPRLAFEIFHQDDFGRHELYGYAVTSMPTTPGMHEFEVPAWRPTGTTFRDQMQSRLLGIHPQLKNIDQVHESADRFRLVTETMGRVHLRICVMTRGMKQFQVSA